MYLFVGGRELTLPENTPWFTKWRTTFLQIQNVSEHEYTKHFLGCKNISKFYSCSVDYSLKQNSFITNQVLW